MLDLHGNKTDREVPPEGCDDRNVFDIKQGVAIGLFVKRPEKAGPGNVYWAEIWGPREVKDGDQVIGGKYKLLNDNDLSTIGWKQLKPTSPHYLFVPREDTLRADYEAGWAIPSIMPVGSVGIATARDDLTIASTEDAIFTRVEEFSSLPVEEARKRFHLGKDVRDWQVSRAQRDVLSGGLKRERVARVLYRPFDVRYTYYTGRSRGFLCRPRPQIMRNILNRQNIGLCVAKSIEIGRGWEHVFCASHMIDHHVVSIKEVNYLFPLYRYLDEKESEHGDTMSLGRYHNIAVDFIRKLEE